MTYEKAFNGVIYGALFILAYTIFDKIIWTFTTPPKLYNISIYFLIVFVLLPIIAILKFRDATSIVFYYTALIWYLFGVEDALFYILFLQPVPKQLPWLNESFFVGGVSKIFGFDMVNNTSLAISVLIAFMLTLPIPFIVWKFVDEK